MSLLICSGSWVAFPSLCVWKPFPVCFLMLIPNWIPNPYLWEPTWMTADHTPVFSCLAWAPKFISVLGIGDRMLNKWHITPTLRTGCWLQAATLWPGLGSVFPFLLELMSIGHGSLIQMLNLLHVFALMSCQSLPLTLTFGFMVTSLMNWPPTTISGMATSCHYAHQLGLPPSSPFFWLTSSEATMA